MLCTAVLAMGMACDGVGHQNDGDVLFVTSGVRQSYLSDGPPPLRWRRAMVREPFSRLRHMRSRPMSHKTRRQTCTLWCVSVGIPLLGLVGKHWSLPLPPNGRSGCCSSVAGALAGACLGPGMCASVHCLIAVVTPQPPSWYFTPNPSKHHRERRNAKALTLHPPECPLQRTLFAPASPEQVQPGDPHTAITTFPECLTPSIMGHFGRYMSPAWHECTALWSGTLLHLSLPEEVNETGINGQYRKPDLVLVDAVVTFLVLC